MSASRCTPPVKRIELACPTKISTFSADTQFYADRINPKLQISSSRTTLTRRFCQFRKLSQFLTSESRILGIIFVVSLICSAVPSQAGQAEARINLRARCTAPRGFRSGCTGESELEISLEAETYFRGGENKRGGRKEVSMVRQSNRP